jgi:hypothetical protein
VKVLSICTGMGLLDRGFADEGFEIVGGCEIHEPARNLYEQVMGHALLEYDLTDLVEKAERGALGSFDGIIGGPPCQSHSKLRARWTPKFPDLTPLVQRLVDAVKPEWFVFENVVPLDLEVDTEKNLIDAMHFAKPHQSRPRWFTHSVNVAPPSPVYSGGTTELLAYPGVYGKLYGGPRAAILQGYPEAIKLNAPSKDIVMGLANAVHLEVARAWARAVKVSLESL